MNKNAFCCVKARAAVWNGVRVFFYKKKKSYFAHAPTPAFSLYDLLTAQITTLLLLFFFFENI